MLQAENFYMEIMLARINAYSKKFLHTLVSVLSEADYSKRKSITKLFLQMILCGDQMLAH